MLRLSFAGVFHERVPTTFHSRNRKQLLLARLISREHCEFVVWPLVPLISAHCRRRCRCRRRRRRVKRVHGRQQFKRDVLPCTLTPCFGLATSPVWRGQCSQAFSFGAIRKMTPLFASGNCATLSVEIIFIVRVSRRVACLLHPLLPALNVHTPLSSRRHSKRKTRGG